VSIKLYKDWHQASLEKYSESKDGINNDDVKTDINGQKIPTAFPHPGEFT